MLLDGVTLTSGSEITNAHVETVTSFPVSPDTGRIVYLTQAVGQNDVGLYVYDGTEWKTGDISKITAGTGLTGGGSIGDITIAVDTGVIATVSSVTTGLSGKEATITAGTTGQYWRGDKSWQTLDKSAVGLSNVDNTSDANKPVSTATQSALDLKAPLANPTFTGTVSGVTKAMVGLGNVDNTSDVNKPISTATQSALDLKLDSSSYTASDVLTKIKTVDGTGSGLDADTLDGNDSAYFATASALSSHTSDATAHLTSTQNTWIDAITATSTEVNYLSGVTSSIQTQLGTKEVAANKGAASGYCPLNASTKIDSTYLPDSIVGQLEYQGVWNANTNSPTIPAAATANKGFYYVVSVSGATTVSGVSDWVVGDWVVSNGTSWDKVDNTDAVSSVNGRLGAITLDKTDVGLGNVDNTSDVNKPISTATQTALNGKEATITAGTTSQYWRGDKSWQTLDKSAVGLSNVENTALSTWAGSANITTLGTVTSGTFSGTLGAISGASLTSLNASNLASGTVPIARMPSPTYDFFTATAGQTVFTFTNITNVAGSKRLMVFVNGVKQIDPAGGASAAYSETATAITFSSGLSAGTPVECYFR